jgi:mannose-6-phosphate isomerase-like protein (cupin superfamily)
MITSAAATQVTWSLVMPAKIIASDPDDEYWFEEGCHILEVSNHPDDPQVSIARARVGVGDSTQWHCLEGVCERYLVMDGQGIVEIGDEPPTVVQAGTVVIIPPGTRQRIRNTGDRDLMFYAICSPRFTRECYRVLEE